MSKDMVKLSAGTIKKGLAQWNTTLVGFFFLYHKKLPFSLVMSRAKLKGALWGLQKWLQVVMVYTCLNSRGITVLRKGSCTMAGIPPDAQKMGS